MAHSRYAMVLLYASPIPSPPSIITELVLDVPQSNSFMENRLRAATRLDSIQPFRVMEVQRRALELERQGTAVIHMEIGQPDFRPPLSILTAGANALLNKSLGYSDALGIPELREAISDYYLSRLGIPVPKERIVITSGASGALLLTLAALVNPGEEVLMADPSYPCYRHFVRLFGGTATCVPTSAQNAYQLTLADIKRCWSEQTRGVIIASPSNPTGTLISAAELKSIAMWISEQGGYLISDEIYQELVYDGPKGSAIGLGESVFAINSFSKFFCMTGWRLGWAVVPEQFMEPIEKLTQNIAICAPVPAQYAALGGFSDESLGILDAHCHEYLRRRDFVLPRLRMMGFDIPITPTGAFYVYAGCQNFSSNSTHFARDVLEQAAVALTPGSDFGTFRAEQFVRISYTRSLEELDVGLSRLEKFLA